MRTALEMLAMPTRRERANAIRALTLDAVNKANSGHVGAPMGMADIAEVLWREVLKHSPGNPDWWDRDRFVLSNGHGSMLLYSLLHLTGYDVTRDDIVAFRQLHSRTPGHPERGETPGVETTTGPLGQGFANAVGMALAERVLAARFNRPGHAIVDHRTWVFLGDGCLMEGISHEVASLAGTLGLGKLVAVYDDNGISIDGKVSGWFADDTPKRFEAYGWRVVRDVDGQDGDAVARAIAEVLAGPMDAPTLLCCRTTIGFGSPNKAGSYPAHGTLGADETQKAREHLGWDAQLFDVPQPIRDEWNQRARGDALETTWKNAFAAYAKAFPAEAAEYERTMRGELPANFDELCAQLVARAQDVGAVETRKASGNCLDILGPALPELIGGSADLSGSNNTNWKGSRALTPAGAADAVVDGNYINYGVREFGMTAIANGIALHGGLIPYTGTFLTFMDYARNAVRLAALMNLRNIMVYTHDSLAVGEDGPTHQPVEQTASLRAIPNMSLWRPADGVETAVAWRAALLRKDGPTALILTRQKLPALTRDATQLAAVARGGYVLRDAAGTPDLLLIATGSEVSLALAAADILAAEGRTVRVVSMPSVDTFLAQDAAWRDGVLPPAVRNRVAIEAGYGDAWYRFVGLDGLVLGVDRFGLSAPGDTVMAAYGFTADAVAARVRAHFPA
jgi:transketolase